MTSSAQYPTPAPIVTSFMSATGERTSVPFQRLIRLASYWNALSAHMDYPPRMGNPDGPVTALVMVEQHTHYEPRIFQWNPQLNTWQQTHPNYSGSTAPEPEPVAVGDELLDWPAANGWDAVETDTPQ